SDIRLIEQIAQILSKSCKTASKSASMISIDEPILGVIVGVRIPFKYTENEIKKILDVLRESCGDTMVGMHICGRISPKLANILLETSMDFLSHEFYDSPENIKVYNPEDLRRSGKILSVGCLSSRNPKIESPHEIFKIMIKFRDFGDCLIFTPDCGFRNLVVNGSREKGYEIAIKKLRNMVEASTKVKEFAI
ncbi:hypothetical protein KEJ17_04380, partial [Candidatus Bathyarchaeota archaeon]|nr:hypothetical protein [Candidatus Bathyarchaeota archaeon]